MAVSLHGNNGLVTTNGTAAAPSLAAPDTDTGLYFGTNLIHATTDGTERLRITSAGKVGINTDAPDVRLHVQETTTETVPLRVSTDNSTNKESTIGFENTTGSTSSYHVRLSLIHI